MSLDDRSEEVAEHLARGNEYLRRARLIGAGLTVFFVAHLEFILFHCVEKLGVLRGFFAITYPLVLGGFILSVLLWRRGEG